MEVNYYFFPYSALLGLHLVYTVSSPGTPSSKGILQNWRETSRTLTNVIRGQDWRLYKDRSGNLVCLAWESKREANSSTQLLEGE